MRLSQGTVVVELDTSGTVDVAAERRRLEKDLAAAQKELAGTEGKLGNDAFLAKAPADVVDKIRERQQVAREEVDRITGTPGFVPMTAEPPDELTSDGRRPHARRDRVAASGRASARSALAGNEARTQHVAHLRADGNARFAAAQLSVDPHRGHQRQDVGGANGRCAADRAASPHRAHHQPAPAVGGRAHLDRRQADHARAVRRDLSRDRTVRAAGRPAVRGGGRPGG